MTTITIKDRPCGWGKTTEMMKDFQTVDGPILCVVPSLSECDRVIAQTAATNLEFHQPGLEFGTTVAATKSEHVEELIAYRKNIVCTHELFYRIGKIATSRHAGVRGSTSPMSQYNLFIDEVINPFDQYKQVTERNFRHVYLDELVTVTENGLVKTTKRWDELYQAGVTEYSVDLYEKVKSGGLYFANGSLFIMTMPLELLTNPKSVQVLTFQSEGSFFRRHLENLIDQGHSFDLMIDQLDPFYLKLWKEDVRKNLTICEIPSLNGFRFSYGKQTTGNPQRRQAAGKKVAYELYDLGRRDGPLTKTTAAETMITCAKSNWFGNKDGQSPTASYWSKGSRMFGRYKGNNHEGWKSDGAQFVPNTTRGTNKYSDCSHAIYLYDQHPNPQVVNFLGFDKGSPEYRNFADDYALTELIQWLFRSRIRRGGYGLDVHGNFAFRGEREKTTVFIPCERMRRLLETWLQS